MGFLSRLFGRREEQQESEEEREERRERERDRRERREIEQQTPRVKSWREQQHEEQCYLKYDETINPPGGQDVSHMPDEERRAYYRRHISPLSKEEQSIALSRWADEMAKRKY